jgi:glycerophosphoryl diester phosphodiesterase
LAVSVLRLAHRGDWRVASENTLAAFRAALRVPGCDGIEFDVRAAADGEPVVIHDATLERVQGRAGRVARLTAGQLAAHGVPALAEVCAAVGDTAFLDVEFKEWVPAGLDALAAARGADAARLAVSSFDGAILEKVGRARPAWPRWLNTVGLDGTVIARARALGCGGIAAQWRAIDPPAVARVAAAGLELIAWTVRRRPTYRRLERLGMFAICAEAAALDGPA